MRQECKIPRVELDLWGILALVKGPLLIIDTETTGLCPAHGDRVLALGMLRAQHGWTTSAGFVQGAITQRQEMRTWNAYLEHFNPEGRRSSPEAARVHGLTDEYLSKRDAFGTHAQGILEILNPEEGQPMLVGHNVPFDISFLDAEFARCGHSPLSNPVLDTRVISKILWPTEKGSLDALCERLGVDRGDRDAGHDALDDCYLVAACIPSLITEIEQRIA